MGKLRNNETGSAILVVLVLIIVALIAIVGYMVYKNHSKTPAPVATTTTTKPTKTTATDPYAGWKTYQLQYEKLSFKYPSSWTVSDQSAPAGKHDDVLLTANDNFVFTIIDGVQNGGDPLPLVSNDPASVTFLGKPAFVVFINSKNAQASGSPVIDTSKVGSAILLTNPNSQASAPADKNVIGSSQYNGVNGPEGSYMNITMGYNKNSNDISLQNAKTDAEYKNGELVIQSMHY